MSVRGVVRAYQDCICDTDAVVTILTVCEDQLRNELDRIIVL